MTNVAQIFADVLAFIYAPMDFFMPIIFWYAQSFLLTLTVGVIGIMTAGKALSLMRKKLYNRYLKNALYIYYIGYTVHSLGVFTNLATLNLLDWTTVALGIIAPICMIIVGSIIKNAKYKGYKIFTYFVIMLLYLFISWLWSMFMPQDVNFLVLFWVWVIVLIVVGGIALTEHVKKGGEPKNG